MVFIDTHAHLFFEDFDGDRAETISRAAEAGVKAVFDVGLDFETNRAALDLAAKQPGVFPIIGFHPHEAKSFDPARFSEFITENATRAVGLGEFGLDFYKEYSPRDTQRRVFEQALHLCIPTGKPLVFHCRAAADEMIAMLRAAGAPLKGVMHCFPGGLEFLERTLELGLHISVGGPVTYPKNDRLRDVVGAVPMDRLLLETDCPFLAPQERRGRRNEPACIPIIAREIAEIKKLPIGDIADVTTANAVKLFGGAVADWVKDSG